MKINILYILFLASINLNLFSAAIIQQPENERDMIDKAVVAADGKALEAKKKLESKLNKEETFSSLMSAIGSGNEEEIERLIAQETNVNKADIAGYTPLLAACIAAIQEKSAIYMDIINSLIKAGSKVNIKNVMGETALTISIKRGLTDIVKILLQAKADPNLKGDYEFPPLTLAIDNGNKAMVELLIASGVNLESRDGSNTPLTLAVNQVDKPGNKADRVAIIKLLIKAGSNINADGDGITSLMTAAFLGEKEVVKLLLNAGANLNVRVILPEFNGTAESLALLKGHKKIVELLQNEPERRKAGIAKRQAEVTDIITSTPDGAKLPKELAKMIAGYETHGFTEIPEQDRMSY